MQQLASFQLLFSSMKWNSIASYIACNKTEKAPHLSAFHLEISKEMSQLSFADHFSAGNSVTTWSTWQVLGQTEQAALLRKSPKKKCWGSAKCQWSSWKSVFLGQAEVRLVCWMISCSKIGITIKSEENDALCVSAMSCISLINFRGIKPRFESTFHHVHGIRCIRFFHH